ncbi:MAG TPA: OsmC family protein [Terriglobales bacterium]|nr:OsmC family protein [Terriglobales bacterium]
MTKPKVVNALAVRVGVELFTVKASGHSIAVDSNRERNTAPSPMELVLMGLCACTATDIDIILRKKREPFTSLEVRAEAERATDPPQVYTRIKLIFTVGGKVTKKAMEDAVRLSEEKYCSVSAMLQKTAKITTEVRYAE